MGLDDELVEVGKWIHGDHPREEVLDRVSQLGLHILPKAFECSTVLAATPHEATIGGSDGVGRKLDERQRDLGHGPCLDAAYGGACVIVDDFETETRWPDYAPTARKLGVRSSISVALPAQSHVVGAINWYGRDPSAFGEDDREPALEYAAKVATIVTNAHLFGEMKTMAENMRIAMETRAVIEQAKGIIMATSHCDAERAFQLLVEQSQHENRKLRDLAIELVHRQLR